MQKRKLTWVIMGVLAIGAVVSFSFSNVPKTTSPSQAQAHRMLALRHVGHGLLRLAGDSLSPLPPVTQPQPNEYLLNFPGPMVFDPLVLYELASATLEQYEVESGYRLAMINCTDSSLAYGFEVSMFSPEEVSCIGREHPKGCYSLRLTFLESAVQPRLWLQPWLWAFSVVALAAFGFIFYHQRRVVLAPHEETKTDDSDSIHVFEDLVFSPEKNELRTPEGAVVLSDKERKVLQILFEHANQLVSRDQLLKEGWEDEGVYTSRSLDMFISKLRKKLSGSVRVAIVTVRGQGYKLTAKG